MNQDKHLLNNLSSRYFDFKTSRSSPPEIFLGKFVLKICSKLTAEHPYQSVISIKLLCNFIEMTLRHGCSPVSMLHIFRTPFPKSTFGRLLPNKLIFLLTLSRIILKTGHIYYNNFAVCTLQVFRF